MNPTRATILVIGILVIFGLAATASVWILRDAVNNTMSPVQSMTGDLGTRVAQVLNPTPTILPDPITIVREVRALSRLETIQYTVEKIITAETGQEPFGFLFGDQLIFVAHGYVIAGVDLSKLDAGDLRIENGVLYVKLPDAEVFVASLDNEKSYIYDRDKGILTKGDVHLETAARSEAEKEIRKSALEDGITDTAHQNAEIYLYRLFRQLGFEEVIFKKGIATPST